MFPDSNSVTVNNETKSSSGTKSYLFDFGSGDFVVRDGKLVECDGIDAIKVSTGKTYNELLKEHKGGNNV